MGECDAQYYDIADNDINGRNMNVLHLAVHCADSTKASQMVKRLKQQGKLHDALLHEDYSGQTPLAFADEELIRVVKNHEMLTKELEQLKKIITNSRTDIKRLEKIQTTYKTVSGGKRKTRKNKGAF